MFFKEEFKTEKSDKLLKLLVKSKKVNLAQWKRRKQAEEESERRATQLEKNK